MPRQFSVAPQGRLRDPRRRAISRAVGGLGLVPAGQSGRKRPGVFYVNTWDLPSRPTYLMQAIYLHEAVPGHHFQVSLSQETDELPRFRRHARFTAYDEGWALYAESLGHDLGLYDDPYSELGALMMEIWRAARLVVDTGLHSEGWTREQAIDYMRANTVDRPRRHRRRSRALHCAARPGARLQGRRDPDPRASPRGGAETRGAFRRA